jgi:hypothetical protein
VQAASCGRRVPARESSTSPPHFDLAPSGCMIISHRLRPARPCGIFLCRGTGSVDRLTNRNRRLRTPHISVCIRLRVCVPPDAGRGRAQQPAFKIKNPGSAAAVGVIHGLVEPRACSSGGMAYRRDREDHRSPKRGHRRPRTCGLEARTARELLAQFEQLQRVTGGNVPILPTLPWSTSSVPKPCGGTAQ